MEFGHRGYAVLRSDKARGDVQEEEEVTLDARVATARTEEVGGGRILSGKPPESEKGRRR